ncbi:glycosyltransferase family 4 protein [Gemmata sp.]|uniref:glycosyltransferase family 4 protein n=1 Tax=Gemmata sp. TaxID=1914242 RepID=UPI003F6F7B04
MSLVAHVGLAVRAVRLKFRLLTAYDTFWPAAARGGRLLLSGRVGTFTRKLFNELPDARDAAPVEARRAGPPLFLAGHVLGLGGYDHLVLNILKGLTHAGINVCRDRRACFRKQLVPVELRPTEQRRRSHNVRLAVAPPHLLKRYRPDHRTAAFTMWETDTLPPGSVRQLNRCGLVLVPSAWGRRCFRANGVRVPIEVVPLGYDPATFSLLPDVPAPVRGRPVTTFGTAGALDEGGLRKNVQRVIDLFQREFPSDPGVRLRVKITPNSPRVETRGDARVEVLDTHLSPTELADWYRSLSVFVNASAGEGFGLHLLEAMACGVPLISSRFGGVGAFFDSRSGYEVRWRPARAQNAVYEGTWSDPDDGDIRSAMRLVYRDGETARLLGAAAAERATQFRWDDTAKRLVIALIRHGFIQPQG